MTNPECVIILITCKDEDEARKIADGLLTRRQAACVNIIPRLVSMFHWQGKIDQADEALLLIKTRAALFEAVRKTARELHSYQTPEIIAVPLADGDNDYTDWINLETQHDFA